MKRLLAIFTGRHQPDREALSAYLDGELAPTRASELEAHIAACDACALALGGMREVRTMLRAMPEVDAPRSFRLRAADVEAQRRGLAAPPTPLMRAMPVLSGTAVLVFAIAVSFDVAGNGGSDRASAPLAAMADNAAETTQDRYGEPAGAGADGSSGSTAPAPGAESADPPEATPEAPAVGAIAPDAGDASEDPTMTAAFEARQPSDSDAGAGREIEATSAAEQDGDDRNNLALRIVQIASAVVAISAAVVAVRLWRQRGETTA